MSPRIERESGRVPRISLLGAFLVLTVGFAAWLGYEAVTAAGSQRQTAEAVLRDYAEIALYSFAREARDDLDDILDEAFGLVERDLQDFDGGLPDPRWIERELREAGREAGCRRCRSIGSPHLVFTADSRGREVRVRSTIGPEPDVLALVERILARPAAGAGAAAASPEEAAGSYRQGIFILPEGRALPDSVAVGYGIFEDPDGASRVMGFVVGVVALQEILADEFSDRRLLPEPIGGGLPNDSLLQVTVRDPTGLTIYRSPVEYPTTLSVGQSLGPESGDLTAEVALRPDQASRLIIGGLPRTRLPLLVTLLVLTLGVGGAALVQLRREAEFQRLRDDFVSGVSHELRTPLAQIRMFAELQDQDKLSSPEDRTRANAVIHREARRLSHLVDNILQFSRLRHAGTPAMPREDLDLAEALEDGVDAMGSLLHDRAMSLRFEREPGVRVRANREALTRVIVNLLDNAAKYGPAGQEVVVDVRRVNGTARITVRDQGPGVPAPDRNRVWKAYRRLERDVKARLPGSGIGLSVVSQLVSIHGGEVRVEDAQGGGARFIVELPLAGDGGTSSGGDLAASSSTRRAHRTDSDGRAHHADRARPGRAAGRADHPGRADRPQPADPGDLG